MLLMVDHSQYKIGLGRNKFDFLSYFSRNPRLQELLATYVFLADIDGFAIYRHSPRLLCSSSNGYQKGER
jgi:hypothetical protein